MRETILAEQTHAFVRGRHWQVAVLPFGATEPHNLHMPYGTDTLQVEELGRRACARAWDKGARVALLPSVPYGVNTNHLRVPGGLACSVTPTTLLALVTDLAVLRFFQDAAIEFEPAQLAVDVQRGVVECHVGGRRYCRHTCTSVAGIPSIVATSGLPVPLD